MADTGAAPDAGNASADNVGPHPTLVEVNQQLVLAILRAQTAEDALCLAARHKEEFLAMVGHELRNPLASIRNVAALLPRIGGDARQLIWAQGVLVRQVEHLSRLVDDLLDLALVARGQFRVQRQRLDLRLTVAQAVERAAPARARRQHRLRTQLPTHEVWVDGDAVRLAQVLDNLLANAIKYTDDGGEIAISLEVTEGSAVLRLRDNGLGMTAEMLPRIFELFVQDARAIDRSQGGLGIGLALVQHLLKLHDGSVAAFSDGPDTGSEFVVRLPVLAAAGADTCTPVPAPAPSPSPTSGRVLIVDDDAEAGDTLALLLRLDGWQVARAADLASALQAGRSFQPEVVLMDIALPGADGYEVARQMRGLPQLQHAHFIALTGFGQPADHERSASALFASHLVKPVDLTALDGHMRRALQRPALA